MFLTILRYFTLFVIALFLSVGSHAVEYGIGPDGTGYVQGYLPPDSVDTPPDHFIGPNENLESADLTFVDLSDANLSGANLKNAILQVTNLNRANLENAILTNADLSGTRFNEANLRGADLSNTWVFGTIFSDADLTGANLSYTNNQVPNYTNAILRRVNFTGAIFNAPIFFVTDLSGANFSNADLSLAQLQGTVWDNVKTTDEYDLVVAEKDTAIAAKELAEADLEAAVLEKDAAIAAKELAETARDDAITEKELAEADLEAAFLEKDAAIAAKELAETARDDAIAAKELAEAQRDARLTHDEVIDLRPGSSLLEVNNGIAQLTMSIEESFDLENWYLGGIANFDIPVEEDEPTKFFRVMMGSIVLDSDNDGVADDFDAFPNDPSESKDTDEDGVGDNADAFPEDASETADTDGDGLGDNADAFPEDASETADTDGDGLGDNEETNIYFTDPNLSDTDGDGLADNLEVYRYLILPSPSHGYWTVETALIEAEQRGGYLARITSESEWNRIKALILPIDGTDARFYLIDGTDAANEGHWVLGNGESLSFSNWGEGEPSNQSEFYSDANEADYLAFRTDQGEDLQWVDFPSGTAFTAGGIIIELDPTDPNDADSDDDGINDNLDAYPNDPSKTLAGNHVQYLKLVGNYSSDYGQMNFNEIEIFDGANRNIALSSTITTNSSYSDGGLNNLIDGSLSGPRYSTKRHEYVNQINPPIWIDFDFNESIEVNDLSPLSINVYPQLAHSSTQDLPFQMSYDLYLSEDGNNWYKVESYDNVAANTRTLVNSSSFSNPSTQPNLVLYYPFDNSIADYSGYGNDLGPITTSSHTFIEDGADNEALKLNGINDGLQTTNTFSNPESFTLSLWINSEDNSGRVIENEWGNGPWVIYKYDSAIMVSIIPENRVDNEVVSITHPISGQWNHVTFTYSNETHEGVLYINGVKSGSFIRPMDQSKLTSNRPLKIGGLTQSSERLAGNYDEVKLYNRVLTENEILAEYNDYIITQTITPNYYPVGSIISGDDPIVVSGFPNGRHEWFGHSVAMNGDGTIVAAGAYKNSEVNSASGAVRVFKNQNGHWLQMGEDLLGNDVGEAFGSSVSLNSEGTILAVGCYNATPAGSPNSQIGNVKVFQYDNSSESWQQIGSDIMGNGGHKDWSGWQTALNGDGSIVAIGAANSSANGNQSGYVKVYTLTDGDWMQLGNTIVGEQALNRIGDTLDIDNTGNTLAVGSGILNSVDVYELFNNTWVQKGERLVAGHNFDLSSDGNLIAIADSEHNSNHNGSFRVFEYEDGEYLQVGNTVNADTNLNLGYDGVQITNDGTRVFVAGSEGNPNPENGEVVYYDYINGIWEKQGSITYGSVLIGNYHGNNEIAINNDGSSIVIGDRTVNNMTGEIQVFSNNQLSLHSGLVAHYPFDNDANDHSGYENHGSVQQATLTEDRFGFSNRAYNFNGSSYINLGPLSQLSDQEYYSQSVWIKSESNRSSSMINPVITKRSSTYSGWLTLGIGENNIDSGGDTRGQAALIDDRYNYKFEINSDSQINDGEWHHLVSVRDGSSFKLFVNGQLVSESSLQENSSTTSSSSDFYLGYHPVWNRYFIGAIDDVRIYDRPLSSSEINQLYEVESDANTDHDNDGLTNYYEIHNHRNPFEAELFDTPNGAYEIFLTPGPTEWSVDFNASDPKYPFYSISDTDAASTSLGTTVFPFSGYYVLENAGWQGTVSNLFDGINVLNNPEAFTSAQSHNSGGVILQANTSVRFQLPESKTVKGFYIFTDSDRSVGSVRFYKVSNDTEQLIYEATFDERIEYSFHTNIIIKVDIPNIVGDTFSIQFGSSNSRLVGADPRVYELDLITEPYPE